MHNRNRCLVNWSCLLNNCLTINWSSFVNNCFVLDWSGFVHNCLTIDRRCLVYHSLTIDWSRIMNNSLVLNWSSLLNHCFLIDWSSNSLMHNRYRCLVHWLLVNNILSMLRLSIVAMICGNLSLRGNKSMLRDCIALNRGV